MDEFKLLACFLRYEIKSVEKLTRAYQAKLLIKVQLVIHPHHQHSDNQQWFVKFVGDKGRDSYEFESLDQFLNENVVAIVLETSRDA